MATTTPNFGWDIPQSTDLVKDGATAIAALGTDIDTALVDLKGGTTGQVLSKASNTDLDFTWSSVDPLTILDAKGDLISATAADTPARLAVGADGTYLQADSTTATGLKWGTVSAGGMTLISTTSLSGASTVISSIPGTYKNLQLVIRDLLPATDGAYLHLRVNGDSGANRYQNDGWNTANGSTRTFGSDAWVSLAGPMDNSITQNLIIINFYDYANTDTWKYASLQSIVVDSVTTTSWARNNWHMVYNQTSAISSITTYMDSGNITSGTALLYGVS